PPPARGDPIGSGGDGAAARGGRAEATAASPGDRTRGARSPLARGRGALSLPDARRLPALRGPRGLAGAQPRARLARPEGHAAGVPRCARDHAFACLRGGRERGASGFAVAPGRGACVGGAVARASISRSRRRSVFASAARSGPTTSARTAEYVGHIRFSVASPAPVSTA